MNKDFERWYEWILGHIGYIERVIAVKYYSEAYNCNCSSCLYRKDKGLQPINTLNGICKLTDRTALDLENRVKRYLAG